MSNRLRQARGLSKKPLTLCEYLAACGGIRLYRRSGQRESYRGELLASDADKWHLAAPFRKKLVRDDSGLHLEAACEVAWEAGYFPGLHEPPEFNQLLDLIAEDLRFGNVYSEFDFDELERFAIQEEAPPVRVDDLAVKRAIPDGAVAIWGMAGDVVYQYEGGYRNSKGVIGTLWYAKAFRAGERNPTWHRSFRSDADRDSAVQEFFANNLEMCDGGF